MALIFKHTTDGSDPVTKYLKSNGATILKGQIGYLDASGYVTNETVGSAYCHNIVGVCQASITAGSAVMIPFNINRNSVYGADSTAVCAQTDVGTDVACTDNLGIISESTAKTDKTAIVKIIKYISASTSQGCEVMLNFTAPQV